MIEQFINPFFDDLAGWWHLLSPNARMIIGPIVVWGGGFALVVWQIRKQLNNAIRKNQHNEKLKLKLQLYNDFVERITEAETTAGDLGHYVFKIESDVRLFCEMAKAGHQFPIPSGRAPILQEKSSEATRRTLDVMLLLEQWNILDPRLEVFNRAFNVALHDLNELQRKHFNLAINILPTELIDSEKGRSLLPWSPPNQNDYEALKELTEKMQFEIGKLSCWVSDLQVELQNNLLSEMFNNSVSVRQPLDSRLFAVTLAQSKKQIAYFESETDWGKMKQVSEEKAKNALVDEARN